MSSAAEYLPTSRSLKALQAAAQICRGCDLYRDATQTVFGQDRGRPLDSPLAPVAAVTVHPSAILRLRDRDEREAELAAFVTDLEAVATALQGAAR